MTEPGRRAPRLIRRSRTQIAADVDEELRLHLESRAAQLVAAGWLADDALREAEREFGDLEYTRRYCRDVDARADRSVRFREAAGALRQDLAYAARTLRRSPGFTTVALLTLALAVGANTAIFSVASAVLLQPLPFRDAGRLVALYENQTQAHEVRSDMSAADLVDYRAMQHSLDGLAFMERAGQLTYRAPNADPVVVAGRSVSANMFDVLRVGAARGRTFTSDEDAPDKPYVAVIAYSLWQRLLGGDTTVIGRHLTLNGRDVEVVGVMPRGFSLGDGEELWLPLHLTRVLADVNRSRKMHFLFGVARLEAGVSVAAARADLDAAAKRLEAKYPEANTGHYVTVLPMREALVGDTRPALLLLLAAAALVLLIACANLANVTLARTISRRREMAVRAAIGAGRARLARQLLTESVLLAFAGGALGVAIAYAATPALLALNSHVLPPLATVAIDGRVLAFSVAISAITGVLCGLVPALDGARPDLHLALKEGARASAGATGGLRRSLVVAQIALATVLLAGAGLLVRSFAELQQVRTGFDPDHVLTAQIAVTGSRYDSLAPFERFWDDVRDRMRATPGVLAVGYVSGLPLQGSASAGFAIEGEPLDPRHLPEVGYISVGGDYFQTMGIPLRAGRLFDATDLPRGPRVVMLNETAVRRFFPRGDALGRRVRLGPDPKDPFETIVGIVGDVRQTGLESEPRPTVYVDNRQETWSTMSVVVRTAGDPLAAVPVLRSAVRTADPLLAVSDVRSMEDILGASLAARRFSLALVCGFAALALALAAVGVYGVLAYTVSSRTREFGIRLALGASAASVLAIVMRQGVLWLAAGLAIGVAAALAGARVIGGMLYGVKPTDALTFSAVSLVLLAVVVAACAIPARRATRVDPAGAMRAD